MGFRVYGFTGLEFSYTKLRVLDGGLKEIEFRFFWTVALERQGIQRGIVLHCRIYLNLRRQGSFYGVPVVSWGSSV